MGFVEAIKTFYRRYTDFAGRSSRSEYWWFTLFQTLVVIALMIPLFGAFASMETGDSPDMSGLSGVGMIAVVLLVLFMLVNIIPSIALVVRMFHDRDKSGWFYLLFIALSMIPLLGLVVGIGLIVYFCMRGTVGPNRFGPDPLDPYSISDFE